MMGPLGEDQGGRDSSGSRRFRSVLYGGTSCYPLPVAVRIFQSRWFKRFTEEEGIGNSALAGAVARAEAGQIYADLGGEVIKQRIGRASQGESKDFRTIVLFRRGARAFFVYGFSKSQRADIDKDELALFKEAAQIVLGLTNAQLTKRMGNGDFVELKRE